MDIIKTIRAEIERRLKDYWEISFHDTNSYNQDTNVKELKELLSFLSTLESEKPMELEEEVKRYYSDNFDYISSDQPTLSILTNIARHFAEWGYLRAAEKYNEIEYNRQRAEESVPNDLEEAAKDYTDSSEWLLGENLEHIEAAFLAGAEWQKQHDAELIEIAYNDGITIGMTKQKEQMLKEAVEGTIFCQRLNRYIYLKEIDESLHYGDKVRIIVIPNTDEK